MVVLGIAGAVSGLASAGSSSVATPQLGSNVVVPIDKAAAIADRMPSGPVDATAPATAGAAAAFSPEPIPAKLLDASVPVPIPASVLTETNGWLVSNGSNLVAVYAGSAADDPTQGRIVIVRQDLRANKQSVQIVDGGATGPLTIAANAPTGTAVLAGSLPVITSRGTTLKLNLGSNSLGAN